MDVDIFDLTNLSGVPDSLQKELSHDVFAERLLQLFNIAGRELSLDELAVGYYRAFCQSTNEEIKTKKQIMSKMYNMSREKNAPVESVPKRKGIYRIKKKAESE